jgi:hypothetical protein
MSKFSSPYYPPRARRYGRIFTISDATRRRLALDRICLPPQVRSREFLVSLLVPGYAFWARAPRHWGIAALVTSAVFLLTFFIALGYPIGNIAFGLLLSLHSTGVVYLLEPTLAGVRLRFRILVSCAAMAGLYVFLYMPVRNFVQDHWLLPLRIRNRVVVVQRLTSAHRIHRGDWIAYSLGEHFRGNIVTLSGYGFGEILAGAGDYVRFTESACEINGIPRPRRPHMPPSGEIVIPEKGWFVWPDFDIGGGHGYVGEAAISTAMLPMATIEEEQFVGKPFKRWFGRRQFALDSGEGLIPPLWFDQ